ncbi:hypothetical protein D0962_28770 [Leptolyngbyaceae cyanobacterium CCMR0082]|uniref:Uncharacterized protein n=2 Tax=Adonisia turfae TaxID=2950184 RepID=A0A6M0SDZ8_9CYAN|nr:hypothetical protein [Adonisia turfae]NEZ59579.1 hypothetical protein [Adonisia turfae CCMR0081]NEZ66705.1 hypothetical protein [Adonisia turfae CCMR0082]
MLILDSINFTDDFPLIFNAALPFALTTYKDRDLNCLSAVLRDRYPETFESLEAAEKFVNEQHW